MRASDVRAATSVPAILPKADWWGWMLAMTSTFAFSFAPPIARGAMQAGMQPVTLVAIRLTLAAILVGLTIALTNRRLLQLHPQAIAIAAGAGAINGVGMLLFFLALTRVDASMSSMIISTSPLVVLSLLALRGERFTYRHLVRLALGISGVYLVIGPSGRVDPPGVMLLLLSTLLFATHMVLLQWYLRDYDARSVTFYISLSMALVLIITWASQGMEWHDPGVSGWLAIGGLVVVSTYLARLTLVAAVGRIGGGQMAMLAPVETMFTVTWSMLFLGERLTPIQWLGGALILFSALLAIQRLGTARWRPRWRLWSRV